MLEGLHHARQYESTHIYLVCVNHNLIILCANAVCTVTVYITITTLHVKLFFPEIINND